MASFPGLFHECLVRAPGHFPNKIVIELFWHLQRQRVYLRKVEDFLPRNWQENAQDSPRMGKEPKAEVVVIPTLWLFLRVAPRHLLARIRKYRWPLCWGSTSRMSYCLVMPATIQNSHPLHWKGSDTIKLTTRRCHPNSMPAPCPSIRISELNIRCLLLA